MVKKVIHNVGNCISPIDLIERPCPTGIEGVSQYEFRCHHSSWYALSLKEKGAGSFPMDENAEVWSNNLNYNYRHAKILWGFGVLGFWGFGVGGVAKVTVQTALYTFGGVAHHSRPPKSCL